MAEKIVSPGVFTRENDQSFLPQGISQIGAAIIGTTPKGPAFIPTLVESYNEFTKIFGDANGKSYVPYTVRNYLKNAGRATIVRVCGIRGYEAETLAVNIAAYSASSAVSASQVGAILAGTTSSTDLSGWTITSGSASSSLDFIITSGSTSYSASLDPDDDNFISNVFGTSAQGSKELYVYYTADFKNTDIANSVLSGSVDQVELSLTNQTTGLALSSSLAYSTSATPWIQSQTLGNSAKYNLFKFHTFNAGEADIKVSISDIKLASEVTGLDYGTFTVSVRKIGDTDSKQEVLETFTGCTLDPSSNDYIARKIGDQYINYEADGDGNSKLVIYGDYVPNSKYIRVELSDAVKNGEVPVTGVPTGFGTYTAPINGGTFAGMKFKSTQFDGTDWNFKTHMGFDFTYTDNLHVKKPVPTTAASVTGTFSLENAYMVDTSDNFTETAFAYASAPAKCRKFSVAFQGGFNGYDPTIAINMGTDITSASNIMGLNFSSATSDGEVAYKKAIDTVSNPDEFDINMLVMPGIIRSLAGRVVNYANTMCEDRQDTFFLFDGSRVSDTVTTAVQNISDMDSNYAATYHPWVKIYDSDNRKYMWVPPSVVMTGVIAFNDRVAAEWYAPAGLNRGGIGEAVQVYTRLTHAERDTLYEGRVNPIAAFTGQGIVAWGQKTTQVKSSALDRINVRRLLIALKKYIASTTKYLVFEQNTIATRNRFLAIVNPYLEGVQQKQGLYTFKVVMDETNNTPDIIDRNMMVGEIYLQPAKTAEMIVIDFNIQPTGAAFGE